MTRTTLLPTLQETLEPHQQLIEFFGGSKGVRDTGALESALVRPQTGYYETLSIKAAALFQSLCQNLCFVNGNKRVAFACTAVFLRMNGYRLSVIPDDGESFIVEKVIQKRAPVEAVAARHWDAVSAKSNLPNPHVYPA